MTVFDDLIGQPATVAELTAASRAAAAIVAAGAAAEPGGGAREATGRGGMTHAWLFTGAPGSGRSVAARAFAAALQCADGGCDDCPQCRTVRAGTHADVHRVIPDGLSIPVQQMRAIVQTAARRPSGGRWQVVIIEDADRLTEAAANALLKAVEEPPSRTVFLLCAPSTHPEDVSVTIRSRCRVVPLRTPPPEAVSQVLAREGVAPAEAEWAARAAQGHIGRARRLAGDPQARARRGAVLAVPASLRTLGAAFAAADELVVAAEQEARGIAAELDAAELAALKLAFGAGGTGKGAARATRGLAGATKELERKQKARVTRATRDALDRALVDLAAFYRDVLVLQTRARVALAHPDVAERSGAVAAELTPEQALRRLEAVLACRAELELNVKPRVALEALTLALRP